MSEGITPAKTWETAEIDVIGVDLCLVLHGESGNVSIGD